MGGKRFKMFKAERLSLILLSVILAVWALVALLANRSPKQSTVTVPVTDTVFIVNDTVDASESTKSHQKSHKSPSDSTSATKNRPSGKKPKKEKPPVHKRHHLNEPVPQY